MEFKKYKIKDIGKVVGGATPLTKDISNYDGDISWITPNDLSNHKDVYINNGERNITSKGLKEIGNSLLPAGTVLFSSRAPVGYVAIAAKELCTNQGFKSVIPNAKIVYPEYLYYTLGYYKSYIEKQGSGTTFVEVSGATMENIELPFPCLDDQIKIAETLLKIDKKISLNTRMNAELEAMAKQLYDYWFVQFDFPDENGKPYKSSGGKMVYNEKLKREIPEGWEVKTLNQLAQTPKESINPFENPERYYKHYSIPAYDACGSYLVEKGEVIQSNKFIVNKGQILVPKLNPWYNRVILVDSDDDSICSTEFVILVAAEEFIKGFLFYTVKTDNFITYCTKGSTGTSHSQRRVPPEILKSYIVPYNKEFVSSFTACVIPQLSIINRNLEEIKNLTHLRDSLLPMLMNGQVTVE